MQSWCNWHGKDGISDLNGQALVHTIERIELIYPHRQYVSPSQPTQGQAIESAKVSGWSCPVLYLGELAVRVSLVRFKESFGIFRVSPLEGCLEPLCFLGYE